MATEQEKRKFEELLNCTAEQINEIAKTLCEDSEPDPHNSQFTIVKQNQRGLCLKVSGQERKVYFSFSTYSDKDYRNGLRNLLIQGNVISGDGVEFGGLIGKPALNRKDSRNGNVCLFYPRQDIKPAELYKKLEQIKTLKTELVHMLNQQKAFTIDVPAVDDINNGTILPNNQNAGESLVRNKIVFGAPGTGKSYSLKAAYEGDNASFHGRWERVTFYPTYSYAQFVGTYKPIMKPDTRNPDEEKIAYQFVPGPFLRMLVKAANDPDNNYLLIVEEINRANAAAVFGDVFQLLDRTDEGESEYSIGASEDIVRYLEKNGNLNGEAKDYFKLQDGSAELKLPKNLYIWATMNSADQGVFPLDTAFKRRWEFEYIGINAEENVGGCSEWTLEDNNYNSNYKWNEVRKFINDLLSAYGVNEDKMMGPFFVKARQDDGGNYLPIPQGQFESKVLMYLWEDAARMFRRQMFGDVKTYSQLLEKWEMSGMQIFGQDSKLGAEGALRDRYNAFPKPSVQPNHPNGDPQPPDADQP